MYLIFNQYCILGGINNIPPTPEKDWFLIEEGLNV